MTNNDEGWFNNAKLGAITLLLNILCIAYIGVIQSNDLKNQVKAHEATLAKIDTQIASLQDKKVDKETLQMILTSLAELRVDIRDIKLNVMERINK